MQLTSTDLCLSAAGWVSDCGSQSTRVEFRVCNCSWVGYWPPWVKLLVIRICSNTHGWTTELQAKFSTLKSHAACLFVFFKVNYYLKAENIISFRLDVWGREKERATGSKTEDPPARSTQWTSKICKSLTFTAEFGQEKRKKLWIQYTHTHNIHNRIKKAHKL